MPLPLFAFDTAFLTPYLPYAVGSGVVTVLLFTLAFRRRGNDLTYRPPMSAGRGTADWDANDQNIADRRGSVRRDGVPVKVLISAAGFNRDMACGWVMDRSTGGLRLAVPSPITPGTSVQVMAENAPDTTPWTTLVVRSCKPVDNHHELGCEFEQKPPWNVLLLFG